MNKEGYDIALNKAFEAINGLLGRPFKGAFSYIRKRISYEFVKDKFDDLIIEYHVSRPKYKGYYLYAVDGDEYFIPPTEDLIKDGFRGYQWSHNSETYNLKMYTATAIDPITGIPIKFAHSHKRNEIALAAEMVPDFEKNSISIYDRLYFSFKMILKHKWSKNYFIFRCKAGTTLKVVIDFVNSSAEEKIVTIAGLKIRLIKIKNKKNGLNNIFATNLSKEQFTNNEIQKIYFRRWESEIANRDISCTLKIEQFHSEDLNGMLQEIYIRMWYMAFVKIEIAKNTHLAKEFLLDDYSKANLKEVMIFIGEHIPQLLIKFCELTYRKLQFLINRSLEKRKRFSRNYLRQIKSSRSRSYINASTVPRRN